MAPLETREAMKKTRFTKEQMVSWSEKWPAGQIALAGDPPPTREQGFRTRDVKICL
jgi:hypothetical protein